jgi:phosphatidylglycerol:prolipoprotein diacylglycerol transferase
MLTHPMMDPVAFSVFGLKVHWYGIMYVLAFTLFLLLGRLRIKQPHIAAQGWKNDDLDDMLFYGMLGVIIGGRLGEVLFYQPAYFFAHPLDILKVWQGGMSFHGGFIGVMIGMALWARKSKRPVFQVYDFIAPLVPLGYAAGRMGNFINAELPGRIADASVPWAMLWPDTRHPLHPVPVFLEGLRHPSPLYQALVDGVLVFVLLWLFARKQRPPLAVGAMFALLYGCARFFTERYRTPDWEWQIPLVDWPITSGQVLSLPMIAVGAGVLVWGYGRARHEKASA